MSGSAFRYDVASEPGVAGPPDYGDRTRLQSIDRVHEATITSLTRLTARETLFRVRLDDGAARERFAFAPGQFVMVEVPGYGEVPISISSSPAHRGQLELCIRRAGTVTSVLHRCRPGAKVGIRGPFGTSFPVHAMEGGDVLLVAGGLGLAPLRSAIFAVTENRAAYGRVTILYGTGEPSERLFDYQYEQWRRVDGVSLGVAVQRPTPGWQGPVGLVTDLLERVEIDPACTHAVVCGPPVMFKHVCADLVRRGVPMHRMFVSLERRMHCGMGKCCRCMVGSTFTCLDGPVFDYWSVLNLKEAI